MGWKNVKEHYRIKHLIRVSDGSICIGSPYIHDIIKISLDGKLTKRDRASVNADLDRYQREFEADPETLKRLIEAPDTFQRSIPVFTYQGGQILEKFCEELGWPNVTHDGLEMYENTFSEDKNQVVAWAKRNADIGIRSQIRNIQELELKIENYRGRLATELANRERLEADYPDVVAEPED